MINNLKVDIEQTKIPFAQEELIDIFSSLNSKDKEIENYIKFVDLQIVKTEYNKVLVKYISNAQKHFKKIIEDVESKLRECDDMKFWGITEVKLYLKDNKKEKINFDIFNNEEKMEDMNLSDSSEQTSNSEEKELKKFKMNLNSQVTNLGNFSKDENKIDNLSRRKSQVKNMKTLDNISPKKKK